MVRELHWHLIVTGMEQKGRQLKVKVQLVQLGYQARVDAAWSHSMSLRNILCPLSDGGCDVNLPLSYIPTSHLEIRYYRHSLIAPDPNRDFAAPPRS